MDSNHALSEIGQSARRILKKKKIHSWAFKLLPEFPYLLFLTRVNVQLDMESSQ